MNKIEHGDKIDNFNWVKDYNEFLDKVKKRKQTLITQLSYSDLQIKCEKPTPSGVGWIACI